MKHIQNFEGFLNESTLNEANLSVAKDIEKKLNIKLELFGSGGTGLNRDSVFQIRDKNNPNLSKGFTTLQLMLTPDNMFYFTYGTDNSIETSVNPLKGGIVMPANLDNLTKEVYQEAVDYVNSQK